MAVTINWSTKVFSVPQGDLTLIGGTLYEMDTEVDFRQAVNAIMAGEQGIVYEDCISHNTEYTVSGVTYARKIEMINSYKLQFTPDSQWSVRLSGSNNNLFDIYTGVLVQNQVQVIPQNSAGLISQLGIEYSEYAGGVVFDPENTTGKATSGTFVPVGTRRQPVDNLTDAKAILSTRGLSTIRLLGDWTTGATDDVSDLIIQGEYHDRQVVTLTTGCTIAGTQFNNLAIQGDAGSDAAVFESMCSLRTISNFNANVYRSELGGTLTLNLGSYRHWIECISNQHTSPPVLDFNSITQSLIMSDYRGNLIVRNMTGGSLVLSIGNGHVEIESSCTGGTITLYGVAAVTDSSNGTTVVNSATSPPTVADAVWDEDITEHTTADSAGAYLRFLREIQKGEWKITGNQLICYDSDSNEIARFNLYAIDLSTPDQNDPFRRVPV